MSMIDGHLATVDEYLTKISTALSEAETIRGNYETALSTASTNSEAATFMQYISSLKAKHEEVKRYVDTVTNFFEKAIPMLYIEQGVRYEGS